MHLNNSRPANVFIVLVLVPSLMFENSYVRSKSPTAPLHFAMRAGSPATTQPGRYVRSNGRSRAGSRTPSPTPLRATVFSTQPPGTGVEAESQEVRMLQQRLMQRPYYMLDPALAAAYVRADFYAPLNYSADPYGILYQKLLILVSVR